MEAKRLAAVPALNMTDEESAEAVERGQQQARQWVAKVEERQEEDKKRIAARRLQDSHRLVKRLFGKSKEGTTRSET